MCIANVCQLLTGCISHLVRSVNYPCHTHVYVRDTVVRGTVVASAQAAYARMQHEVHSLLLQKHLCICTQHAIVKPLASVEMLVNTQMIMCVS